MLVRSLCNFTTRGETREAPARCSILAVVEPGSPKRADFESSLPDRFAAAWLIAVLSGPLIGWTVGSSIAAFWSASSWRWRTIVWLFVGAGLPSLAALVHAVGNLRRKAPVLHIAVVTAFASAFTYRGWVHLVEGPKTETVTVRQVGCKMHRYKKGGGPCIVSALVVEDGRTLLADTQTTRGMTAPSMRTITTLDDVVIVVE